MSREIGTSAHMPRTRKPRIECSSQVVCESCQVWLGNYKGGPAMANNVEIARGGYEKFDSGDVPGVLAIMADNVVWTEPSEMAYGGSHVGPQAVLDGVFMKLGDVYDEFAVTLEEIFPHGDHVVMLGRHSWKSKSTGLVASVKCVHVFTFNNGKIATFDAYYDSAKALTLL